MNLSENSPEILYFSGLDFFCYLPDNLKLGINQLTSSLHFISQPNSDIYIIIYENVIYVVIDVVLIVGDRRSGFDIPVIFNPCPSIPNDILNTKSRLSNEAILYIFSERKKNKKEREDGWPQTSNSIRLYHFLLETGNASKHLYYHVDALNIIFPCLIHESPINVKPLSKTFINQNLKDEWILLIERNLSINYLKKVARKFCCFTGFDGGCVEKYREYASKIRSQSQKTNKNLKYNDLWFFEPWNYAGVISIISSHIGENLRLKKGIEKIEHKWGEMLDGRIWIKVEGIRLYSEGGGSSRYIDYSNPSSWPEDMQSSIRDD